MHRKVRPNTVPPVPRWALLPGRGNDIGVGADGSAWVIGVNPVGTGSDFGIYRWNGGSWIGVDGGAARIAVGPDGQPWVVNSVGGIHRRQSDGTWVQMPGLGIGIGVDGLPWVIGTNAVGGASDFSIHRWGGSSWVGVGRGGVAISVGPSGDPWPLNSSGAIFHRI